MDLVADLDDQPADEGPVDLKPEHGCGPEHAGEPVAQGAGLGVGQGDG